MPQRRIRMQNNNNFIPSIKRSELFAGISEDDIQQMLVCFNAKKKKYEEGQIIFSGGEKINQMGIVLSGRVYMESNDITGNKSIIRELVVGDILGDLYALSRDGRLIFDAVAHKDAELLFIDVDKVMTPCAKACTRHLTTMKNLLTELAGKACTLDRKLSHMSMRTTREKLMSYLTEEAKQQKSNKVTIQFNRQELADYLCVDRSAMSKELHRMKRDGLIDFSGNTFFIT